MPEPLDKATDSRSTSRVLMVRPACFGANPETAATNSFQSEPSVSAAETRQQARAEFDGLVEALRGHGVDVFVVEDTPEPPKSDAVFPNNWISFHPGLAVLYPMQTPSRQREVRLDVLETLRGRDAVQRRIIDLRTGTEGALEGQYLEGTGSLVLDRRLRTAYACLSPRTAPGLVERFCRELDYSPVLFHATDEGGQAIYHTNVIMGIGQRLAVVCLESIREPAERTRVERSLRRDGRELLELGWSQVLEFAGNMLELHSQQGTTLWAMSARARRSLSPDQVAQLERHGTLVSADLTTIETCGGGSARCMIAEVY